MINDKDALLTLQRGVNAVADAVRLTYGPGGRNVIIQKAIGKDVITKDGVSVAKDIWFTGALNAGASTLINAAAATSKATGDGTTTTVILAQALLNEGVKMVEAGHDVVEIIRGIEATSELAQGYLRAMSRHPESEDEVLQVAVAAANGDAQAGKLVLEALKRAGAEGTVTLQDSKAVRSYVDVARGVTFAGGYVHHAFANESTEIELVNPYIILCDYSLEHFKQIEGTIRHFAGNSRPLLVIAPEFNGSALDGLVVNHTRGNIQVCAVRTPPALCPWRTREILDDLAVLTGASVFSVDTDQALPAVPVFLERFTGSAEKVTVRLKEAQLEGLDPRQGDVESRVARLKGTLEKGGMDFNKEWIQERISSLAGSVVRINVGGYTEVETKELRDRIEDALLAARKALEGGISKGAGLSYIQCRGYCLTYCATGSLGEKVFLEALKAPLRQIAINCGFEGEPVVQKCSETRQGFNSTTGGTGSDTGIWDATETLCSSIINAVSVVTKMLSTAILIRVK